MPEEGLRRQDLEFFSRMNHREECDDEFRRYQRNTRPQAHWDASLHGYNKGGWRTETPASVVLANSVIFGEEE